jgi:hypothetical protein
MRTTTVSIGLACSLLVVAACHSPVNPTASSATSSSAQSTAAPAVPAGLPGTLSGTETPTAVDGPVNCFSKPYYNLLTVRPSLPIGSWQLSQSGTTVTLASVYPTDDGTWSNYVRLVGTRDGTTVTLKYSPPAYAWEGCDDLPPQSITEDDEMVGTLSADNRHLDAVDTRRIRMSAGDLIATWQWSLTQQ